MSTESPANVAPRRPAECDVLAIFAHPDDESLLAGGTLAACAAAGRSVGLLSLTRGEAGPIATAGTSRERLGAEREQELAAAARVLGAAWSFCLSLPDGELQWADRPAAQRAVADVIDRACPRLVLTFAADGLYWHPDHTATHAIVHAAAGVVPVLELTWPQGVLTRVVAELGRRGLPEDVWGLAPEAFGTPAAELSVALDVRRFLDTKLKALAAHRTQLDAGHALTRLPRDLAEDLLGREWLTRAGDGSWLAGVVNRSTDDAVRR